MKQLISLLLFGTIRVLLGLHRPAMMVPVGNDSMEVTHASPGERVIWKHDGDLQSCIRYREQGETEFMANCQGMDDDVACKMFVKEDGRPVSPPSHARFRMDHSLVLENVKESDSGMYMCFFTDPEDIDGELIPTDWRLLAVLKHDEL